MYYIYNAILSSHRKEYIYNTFYNKDEPWKHYAKWKEPDTKGQIADKSIYVEFLFMKEFWIYENRK